MPKSLPKTKQLVPISEASEILGVSIDTIRRWDNDGVINAVRPNGKNRFFSLDELEKIKFSKPLSISEAAHKLKISQSTLRRLENKGLINPQRNGNGERVYDKKSLEEFLNSQYFIRQKVVEEEILEPIRDEEKKLGAKEITFNETRRKVVNLLINKNLDDVRGLKFFRNAVSYSIFGVVFTVATLIIGITVLFIVSPAGTAKFFGISNTSDAKKFVLNTGKSAILGTSTYSNSTTDRGSVLGAILKPLSNVSLQIVKQVSPITYDKIIPPGSVIDSSNTPIFKLNDNGQIVPQYSLLLPEGSSFQLPEDVDAQSLQSKVPGIQTGNLVVFGDNGTVPALSVLASNLEDNSVGSAKLTSDAVFTGNIKDGEVAEVDIADSSITTGKIKDGTVKGEDIADGTVGDGKLAQLTSSNKVAGSAIQLVSGGGLEDSSGLSLLTSCTSNQILVWSGSTWACSDNSGGISSLNSLTGDLTIAGAGINLVSASGTTITITATEADTLSSITGREATTSTQIALNGGFTSSSDLPIVLSSAAPTISIGNTGTLSITDGTNTLFSLADNGTTGTLTLDTLAATNIGAFTLTGNITGSGSPTISSFGTINGATLSGGTISGGTLSGTALSGIGSFTLTGGTAASETLTLVSTSDSTKGAIQFFSSSNKIDSSGNLTIAGSLIASNFASGASVLGSNTGDQTNITGNAGTATILGTTRSINGVSFNGSADIVVTAAAGTLTGSTLNSGVTGSSLTSLGTLSSLSLSGAISGATSTDTINGLVINSGALTSGAINSQTISSAANFTGTVGVTTSLTSPIVYGGSGTTSTLNLRSTSGTGATGADIIFGVGTNGGTEAMRILNSGNVGIGTTSPSSKLYIQSDSTVTGLKVDLSGNTTLSSDLTGINVASITSANAAKGTGADGAVTFSSDTNINTANTISGRSCTDGGDAVNYSITTLTSTTATLSTTPSSGCLTAGDEVLLINLQGTNTYFGNVGHYEVMTVESVSSNTVTFTGSKTKYYGNTTDSDDANIGTATTNQRVMLQRVPNYTNVTVSSGQTLTASAWDGVKGGVLYFKATGTVTVTGYISMNAKGYRGPAGGIDAAGGTGGEAYCGVGGASTLSGAGGGGGRYVGGSNGGNGYCGGGGGSLATGGTGSAAQGGAGGGGGGTGWTGAGAGYGTFGYGANNGGTNTSGNGGSSGATPGVGGGGGTYGSADLTTLFPGASGGAGFYPWGASSAGGSGGGIVGIIAGTVTVTGSITANGENGGSTNASAKGGAGAGGSVLIKANNVTLGSSLVTASAGTSTYNGGAGRIAVYASDASSGTTSPTYGDATSFDLTNTNYGLLVNSISGALSNYSIYTSGSAVSYFGGNVGIGVAAPTAALDVAGDASASGSLVFNGSNKSIDILNGSRLDFQTSVGGDAGLAAVMSIANSGNVGIGTTAPSTALSVVDSVSSAGGGVGTITNTNTTDSSDTVTLRLNTGATSTTTNARFVTFYAGVTSGDSGGTAVGHINLNNGAVAYTTTGADFAERFYVPEITENGDIIGVSTDVNRKAQVGDSLIGVVSDTAGFVGNESEGEIDKEKNPIVGLVGQVKTKVSTENGIINKGDFITVSSIPGVGAKAIKFGQVIGKALEGYSGEEVGKISVLINPSWYDSDVHLSDIDGLSIFASSSAVATQSSVFSITNDLGNVIEKIGAFANVIAANIKAGFIQADKISTKELSSENGAFGNISGSSAVFDNLTINSGGEILINNGQGDKVVSIDDKGNANFAGTLTAKTIQAGTIEGLQILTNEVVANKIALLQSQLINGQSADSNTLNTLASNSAVLSQSIQVDSDSAKILTDLKIDKNVFVALDMTVDGKITASDGLEVSGPAEFKGNAIFNALAEFFGNVIFHGDISFLGRPTFNSDTGGFAVVGKDKDAVYVAFDKEYAQIPVVNISISLDDNLDTQTQDARELEILNGDIRYIVTKRTTSGFIIKLNKAAPDDLKFSWTALAVKDVKTIVGSVAGASTVPTLTPTPAQIVSPTVTPSIAPTPTLITTPSSSLSQALTVDQTPTGYLNVRDSFSISGNLLGQVNPGEVFTVLDAHDNWYKIEYVSGQFGWVIGDYVTLN